MTPNPPDLATALQPAASATDENSRAAASCTIVIFGASGDLTKRKLIPALYEIATQKPPTPRFAVIGFARTPTSDDAFRKTAAEAAGKNGSSDGAGGSPGGATGSRGGEKGGDGKQHDEKLRAF